MGDEAIASLREPPVLVWERFLELTGIPRPSRGEEAARAYVVDWAQRHGWPSAVDAVGNVVVRVPATAGREGAPTVVLQAHLDIVCERDPASPVDPRAQAIRVLREDDWLVADGTTLGADDGIGVALAMAAAEDGAVAHGPLELLLTVCEEQGLEGAKGLDPALVAGRLLVNLDGTSDGSLTVGCAGSAHALVRVPLDPAPLADERVLLVELGGARGGHSGGDIHRGRANAIVALGRLLRSARTSAPLRLATLEGGESRNAIPREASATIAVAGRDEDVILAALDAGLEALRAEHAGTGDDLSLAISSASARAAASAETTARALGLLGALPSGVISFAAGRADAVETSTSLNVARSEGGVLSLASMIRSSSASGLEEVAATIERVARAHGAAVEIDRSYPPWEPSLDSPLVTAARRVYRRLFGIDPRLEVVHGGLECAVLGAKLPGVEMVSLGPTILDPHAPGERVSISSTERAFRLLVALLDDLSRPSPGASASTARTG
ncbi:MAG: beta-Ala-His dipeptidase [Thermoleophilia bacterium]|nr:beta-Ala-His dipeptidase [Thermoleophilia bacterium]